MKTPTFHWDLQQSYLQLPEMFYMKQKPTKVANPVIQILNKKLAESLGIPLSDISMEELTNIFAGNQLPQGITPIAQAYAGHQFGHFTMLGDGRNVLLGERTATNEKQYDIVLKGAGRTFFSRGGDGRASVGPMLREYIISEAMHALNIPTTRSLAVVSTGEAVFRNKPLQGAIVVRVASSHIRVGTFEYALHWGSKQELTKLADYTILRHFPHLAHVENKYERLLYEVIQLQAQLIAKWQLVGFIHGVMNTDNMAISGETIDYGPCAFLDEYDPSAVFSSIDDAGRYAYEHQPYMAEWNLTRFAETLMPLFELKPDAAVNVAKKALDTFNLTFKKEWLRLASRKLGFQSETNEIELLINELFDIMKKHRADFTNTFYYLTVNNEQDEPMFRGDEFKHWRKKWLQCLRKSNRSLSDITALMKQYNPTIIPRNYYVEKVIDAAVEENNYDPFKQLLKYVTNPFDYEQSNDSFRHCPDNYNQSYRTFCGT